MHACMHARERFGEDDIPARLFGEDNIPARLFSNISRGYKQKVFIIYFVIMKSERGLSNMKKNGTIEYEFLKTQRDSVKRI